MTRILLHGCGGKMGRVVERIVASDPSCQIVAGIDPSLPSAAYPVFATPEQCTVVAGVIIDFSTASAGDALLDYAAKTKTPLVLCTTGLSDEVLEKMKACTAQTAILKSANMSIGINLILNLVQKAAEALYDSGFDIEVVEKHHNQKIDAPSGTAMAIADAINDALDSSMHYVYDRSQTRQKRDRKEIGIHAIRGGSIVGEHDVIFAGQDEVITLSHQAMSKEIFAVGAVKAAKYLAEQGPGFYTMADVLQ